MGFLKQLPVGRFQAAVWSPRSGSPSAKSCAYSSSEKIRERMRKRTPSGASTEKPLPRPLRTSTVRWVCFQYSYYAAPMYKGVSATVPR